MLWLVVALKADLMGDIALPISMGHGLTIFQQPQLFYIAGFKFAELVGNISPKLVLRDSYF